MARATSLAVPTDDPHPAASWELYYSDSFDREAPPSIEVTGTGLLPGLVELWARFLFETVQAGTKGFSDFSLDVPALKRVIYIDGDMRLAQRIKEWVFGATTTSMRGVLDEANQSHLWVLARAHARWLARDDGSDAHLGARYSKPVIAAAANATTFSELEAALATL